MSTTAHAAFSPGAPSRQALAYLAFAVVYYLLLAYAASFPMQSRTPMFIWPAHGVALGTLLVAPRSRWAGYLAIILAETALVGWHLGAPLATVGMTMAINVGQPLLVAAALLALPGGSAEIGTLRGLVGFLIGMLPIAGGVALVESNYSYFHVEAPLRLRWAVTFLSTLLGILLTAPLLLAWNRGGWRQAMEASRERWPELLVLFAFLVATTHLVFVARRASADALPPLLYMCAPFLIWAALRFGLRAATLGLALLGAISYWHAGQGVAVPASGNLEPLLNLQGFLVVIVVTTLFAAALVVERHEAIREIEEWRYRHERVIRASGSLLYDMDPVSGEIVWDGDTPGVLGTSPEKISTTRRWALRVHPEDLRRIKGLREDLLEGKLSHVAIEYRFRRDDGEYITVGVNAYRIADAALAGGRRIIGFVKDVSDKVRAEEERRQLEAQLKQAEKMQAVGHLAGGIAHDFNNILGSILGYGELAQERAKDGDLKRYVDTIMHAGNRAKSLVNQILSYSRAEGMEKMTVIVSPIAEETCELLRGSSKPTLQVSFRNEAEGAAVMGDPTRLHQLLMNLCSNAVQAMREQGTLEIVVDTERVGTPRKVRTGEIPPGDYVRITVRDTGHGIAPEVIDRIFEPFFTTKPAGHGTGLGLALVHAVVTEHKGFLDVASKLGAGTTFTVWLPRAHGAEGGGEPRREAAALGRGEVVLAVDDEPEVLAALEEMLAALGYEPAGFRDSREALEAFRQNPGHFDALVSDEVMPGLTGTQLAVEVRKVKPTLPILIASGFGGSGFETRALSAGVNRVLRKPYRMHEIGDVLAGFFAGRHPRDV